jgi:aspartate racemase
MKKIGMVGGIDWKATIEYYKLINQGMRSKTDGYNSLECVIYSVNIDEIERRGWEKSFDILLNACGTLKRSGVDCIVLCGHTAHLFAERLEAAIHLPFIHIVTETAKKLYADKLQKVALLGNRIIMENRFYVQKLEESGLEVLLPKKGEHRDFIHHALNNRTLIDHLAVRAKCARIINELVDSGAECILIGSDSPQQYVQQRNCAVPLVDSRMHHCEAVISYINSQDYY